MKSLKISQVLGMALYLLTGIVFALLFFGIARDKYPDNGMVYRAIVGIEVSLAVFFLLKKYEDKLKRFWKPVLTACLLLIFIVQLIFNYYLEITPNWDFGNVYNGAVAWATTGDFEDYKWYFYLRPVNIGPLFFFKTVFSFVHIFVANPDYAIVGGVTNSIMNVAMIFFSFLIAKRYAGLAGGFASLLIFMVSVPTYLCAPVFYTDVTSMLFPILFYYLYLRLLEAKTIKSRVVIALCMGLSLWLGSIIKFTIVISAVAVLIEMLLRRRWKELLIGGCVTVVVFLLCGAIYKAALYGTVLDKSTAIAKNPPITHWIMMGLNGDGAYNADDFAFTDGIEDPEERKVAVANRIKERLQAMSFKDLCEKIKIKSEKCFCDGTYELTAFFSHGTVRQTWLNKHVIHTGEKYNSYLVYCTGIYLTFFLLMVLQAVLRFIKGLRKTYDNLDDSWYFVTPILSVFGLFLFLLMWETSPRYITNFIPMIYICAVYGMNEMVQVLCRRGKSQAGRKD